jgi:hypothetical protein
MHNVIRGHKLCPQPPKYVIQIRMNFITRKQKGGQLLKFFRIWSSVIFCPTYDLFSIYVIVTLKFLSIIIYSVSENISMISIQIYFHFFIKVLYYISLSLSNIFQPINFYWTRYFLLSNIFHPLNFVIFFLLKIEFLKRQVSTKAVDLLMLLNFIQLSS